MVTWGLFCRLFAKFLLCFGYNPLWDAWFANVPFQRFLFLLLIPSFATQKLFSLLLFPLSIFTLITCAFGFISKQSLPRPLLWCFSPMFFFWEFYKLGSFRSLIHFELVFEYSEKTGSILFSCICVSIFPNTIYGRAYLFTIEKS